jgi:DNA-binding transcriptional regulator GbsR (MarR family)
MILKKQLKQSSTPYQNKVTKCKNCSLVERVKKHGVRKQAFLILVG